MNNDLFRKKALEGVDSPEDLNSYLRITNPPIWFALVAVIVILAGAVIWGSTSRLDVKKNGVVISDGAQTFCFVSERDVSAINSDSVVIVGDERFNLISLSDSAYEVGEVLNDYAMNLAGFVRGEYVYVASLDGNLNAGNYAAQIVVESIPPISFLFNSTN